MALLAGVGWAQEAALPLAVGGCWMAHCDPRMSDLAGVPIPDSAVLVRRDPLEAGSAGLGCASNGRIVACTGRGSGGSRLVAYDADGNRLWEDRGELGPTAWMSAPIVGDDDSVVAADAGWVLRASVRGGAVLWKTAKPDAGQPISPVPLGSPGSGADLIFVATNASSDGSAPQLSVYDAGNGALLAHQPLADPETGRVYLTRNTAAASGNRAYVMANAVDDPADGRMFAIDVCNAAGCGDRGRMTVAWSYPFAGPSGASPLLIGSVLYFDGRPKRRDSGTVIALADDGAAPRRLWIRSFPSPFGVSAAQDPRGGLWVSPTTASHTLLRLNADTGATEQQVIVSSALGLPAGYLAQSALTVSQSGTGAVVLTIGAALPGAPSHVGAIDVSSSPGGSALWKLPLAATAAANAVVGQFPIVVNARGARRVVFTGTRHSTYFVGDP